jgi:hypothetical protein
MGLLADGSEVAPRLSAEQFSGPGIARQGYSEFNQRELLRRWADDLARPSADPAVAAASNGAAANGESRAVSRK